MDECTETDPGTGNLIHDCDPNATCTNTGLNLQTGYASLILDGRKHCAINILYRKWKKYLRQFCIVNSWKQEEVSHVLVMPALPTVVFQMVNNVGHHNFLNSMNNNKQIASQKCLKLGASARWSFLPNSVWGSIETTTIGKARPTLQQMSFVCIR